MVRGPAALLAAYGGSLLYFLIAPALPSVGGGDAATLVGGALGIAALAACALALLQAREHPVGLSLLLVGAGLAAAALDAGGVGAGANPFEALLACSVGLLFARAFDAPAAIVAIPLLVGSIDAWSVFSGPSSSLIRDQPRAVDFLTFDLPAWGGGRAGQLGLSDLVFMSMYAAWACSRNLRPQITGALLGAALIASLILSVAFDRGVPALPLLGAALLLPNVGALRRMFVEPAAG